MLRLVSLFVSVLCVHAWASEHWIRVTTPHFEMYTTNGERQAAAALEQFEHVRYFFLEISPSKSAPSDANVRIIAFRSEKEYKPYRLNGGAFAYYLRSRKVDYIVMQDISSEHYQTATHEYTHLIVEHLGLKLPVWLNEGLADLYSSLEPRGNQAIIGRALPGRVEVLRTERWLDLNTLFAVKEDSPYYNESDKMSIFYAESWALTHMLALGKEYQPSFPKFLMGIAAGRPTADCLKSAFGKTPAEAFKDLQQYLRQSSVQAAIYNVKLKAAELEPQVSDASDFDVQLALADLLAAHSGTMAEAAQRYADLARAHPENADVEESLGYLAWQRGDKAKARECFGRAFAKGSKNAEMMLHYAGLMQEAQMPPEQIVPVLEKASELKPDDRDIWFNLGMEQMQLKHWGAALSALLHVKTVPQERAFSLFSALAFCDLQMKQTKEARSNASVAKQYAKTPEQIAQASQMLDYLDAMDRRATENAASFVPQALPGPAQPQTQTEEIAGEPSHRVATQDQPQVQWTGDLRHVEGTAKSLACDGKVPRLHVLVEGKEMVFELADPQGIVVRNSKGGQFDFHCGAQKPMQIGIFYVPQPGRAGLDGAVRELVF
jgi:tetratricopeptide (TPR) repeat protein